MKKENKLILIKQDKIFCTKNKVENEIWKV